MLGAIIGDIVGSRWEFHSTNDYDFELFSDKNSFTDDTVCTIAVADAILHHKGFGTTLHEWCRRYPHPMGSYGGRFNDWIKEDNPKPYGSFGNGSAMRVSAVGWAFNDEESVLANAEASAACTHNHPEGIKGAQTVALAIHRALQLRKKYAGRAITRRAVREMVIDPCVEFSGYDLNIDWEAVRNKFDETCQGTVPVALAIISQSHSFEDAIRKAVCLGADADTLGAIVGSIAEVIWPIPDEMRKKALSILPQEMRKVVQDFCKAVRPHVPHYVPQDDMRLHNLVIMRWKLGLGNLNNAMFGKNPVPEKKEVATMDMGEFTPMPKDREEISDVEMDFTVPADKMAILRYGHIPEAQEDHWFMVCDEEHIRYFRSWTGACVFEAHYHQKSDGNYCIDRLKMHHGLCQFGVNGDETGTALFLYLLTAEVGGDAEGAWDEYIYAWDALDYKYSQKSQKE